MGKKRVLLRQFAITAFLVAGLSAVLLFNEFHAYNSDAGGNYAQVRAMMDWGVWGRSTGSPNLGNVLLSYPPVSHWLAAELGNIFGSGLRGMTVLGFASVSVFYLVMFAMSLEINWRAPIIACAITIGYALLRGPVFGRMIVNNYFFAQIVGSMIAALILLVALNKFHKWNGIVLDLFVLAAGQIVVATHLMPAAQLLASYCAILLVYAWIRSSWQVMGRLGIFFGASLALTFLNPSAAIFYTIGQFEGGTHINLFGNRFAQIVLLIGGLIVTRRLILLTYREEGAGLFLGCMGLAVFSLALLQIVLFWLGFGTNYAITKHMFVAVSLFILILAANLALNGAQPSEPSRLGSPVKGLVWCSLLSLLTTRADVYPSLLNLRDVVKFQNAVREMSARLGSSDGRHPIALASQWPPNISYGITIGDLGFSEPAAELILLHKPLPSDKVSMLFMPAGDPSIESGCLVRTFSNQDVAAIDYPCFLKEKELKP